MGDEWVHPVRVLSRGGWVYPFRAGTVQVLFEGGEVGIGGVERVRVP